MGRGLDCPQVPVSAPKSAGTKPEHDRPGPTLNNGSSLDLPLVTAIEES